MINEEMERQVEAMRSIIEAVRMLRERKGISVKVLYLNANLASCFISDFHLVIQCSYIF